MECPGLTPSEALADLGHLIDQSPQHVSIAANLRLAKPAATDDDLEAAAARALLADPAVLILDEPAAGLEPAMRCTLTADLLAATAGRSTLLITHESDGLAQVDEIVVLRAGRVVQRGTHDELLRADGEYRRLAGLTAA